MNDVLNFFFVEGLCVWEVLDFVVGILVRFVYICSGGFVSYFGESGINLYCIVRWLLRLDL